MGFNQSGPLRFVRVSHLEFNGMKPSASSFCLFFFFLRQLVCETRRRMRNMKDALRCSNYANNRPCLSGLEVLPSRSSNSFLMRRRNLHSVSFAVVFLGCRSRKSIHWKWIWNRDGLWPTISMRIARLARHVNMHHPSLQGTTTINDEESAEEVHSGAGGKEAGRGRDALLTVGPSVDSLVSYFSSSIRDIGYLDLGLDSQVRGDLHER